MQFDNKASRYRREECSLFATNVGRWEISPFYIREERGQAGIHMHVQEKREVTRKTSKGLQETGKQKLKEANMSLELHAQQDGGGDTAACNNSSPLGLWRYLKEEKGLRRLGVLEQLCSFRSVPGTVGTAWQGLCRNSLGRVRRKTHFWTLNVN